MIIERLFGKDRASRAKARGEDEPKPRPSSDAPGVAGPPSPRSVATDAPASLARAGEGDSVRPSTASATSMAPRPAPTYEEIAARAYELWLSQGCPQGREHENWLEAEHLLLNGDVRG